MTGMQSVPRIAVVGAGPTGLAAAVRAAQSGAIVTVIDDNPTLGGQIWRNGRDRKTEGGEAWFKRFADLKIQFLSSTQVISADARRRTLLLENQTDAFEIGYEKLVLATGARELFLPFPGWTLPNVVGVGGLQALAKSGLRLNGKRIIVAGSGPLLLAAAVYFRQHGAVVKRIAEQASWGSLLRFGSKLFRHPAKMRQALSLRASLGRTQYLPSCWVEAAEGDKAMTAVRLRRGERTWTEACDYLAVSYGLIPNLELPELLGCKLRGRVVAVDARQRTSVEDIYSAGECTGIGGVDQSLLEGEIAGCAAAGAEHEARRLSSRKARLDKFAEALERAFALRQEVLHLAKLDTIVCRCEDVTLERLAAAHSWRAAKLYHRCGMGPCQGRICGPITETLFGWTPVSVRPPLFPARLASLTTNGDRQST